MDQPWRLTTGCVAGILGLGACAQAPATVPDARPADPAPAVAPADPAPEAPADPDMPDPADLTYRPLDEFPGVEIGFVHIHDRGPKLYGVRIAGKFIPTSRMASAVLGTAGWSGADGAARQAIGLNYCQQLLGWHRIVWEATDDFAREGAPPFAPAAAASRPDGGVVVRAWCDDTVVGMQPPETRDYRRHEAVIAPDGTVTTRVLATHSAPIRD